MTQSASETAAIANDSGEIVAGPSRSYRLKWCLMGLAIFAWGVWSIYDGYVKWPEDNRRIAEADRNKQPPPEGVELHTDLDIRLNKIFGITLPPLGAALALWALYQSRGHYRLADSTLHVPGHPPVPLGAIRAIDESKWDRKGIAYIDYELGGKPGRLKIDDYVYEREPTDAIYDRILKTVVPAEAETTTGQDGALT